MQQSIAAREADRAEQPAYASFGSRPGLLPNEQSLAEPSRVERPPFREGYSSDGLASKRYANWGRGYGSRRV